MSKQKLFTIFSLSLSLVFFSSVTFAKHDKNPPIISGVEAISITTNTATIKWTTNELADSEVRYGILPQTNIKEKDNVLSISHSINISGLLANSTYSFCVSSRDEDNNKSESCDYSFTTLAITTGTYRGHRVDLSMYDIKVEEITDKSAILLWSTQADTTSQAEYGLTSSYKNITDVTDKNLVQNHSIKLNYLIPNTEYHFRVISVDVANVITYSIDTTFKTLEGSLDNNPPNYINNLKAEPLGPTSVKLLWTAPKDETGVISYDINSFNKPITEGNFFDAHIVHETLITLDDVDKNEVENSYQVVGLKPGETNYFAIKSIDPYGNISSISNVISVTTLPSGELADIDAPGKVSNIQAAGLDKLIFLSWENPDDEDFVRVRIMRSSEEYPVSPESGYLAYDGDGTKFSDPSLVNGKTYYYSIFSYDDISNYSKPISLALSPYAEKTHYHILKADKEGTHVVIHDLKFGDKGEEVQHLQEHLANDPEIYPEGLVTGYFGSLTDLAVKRLQKINNLEETGFVDSVLRQVLENLSFPNEIIETNEESEIKSFVHDIYLGMQGENVRVLQSFLQKEGLFSYNIITGYFGTITRQAVIDFQKKNNIEPAVGYVGPFTRAKILELILK